MSKFCVTVARKTHNLDLGKLNTKKMQQLVNEIEDHAEGPVVLALDELGTLERVDQEKFWNLWRTLKAQQSVKLRINGELYAEPLDAVLAALVDKDDPQRYEEALQAALIAIGVCCDSASHTACVERVVARLQELGVTDVRQQDLVQLLASQAAGSDARRAGGHRPNPTLLASAFLCRFGLCSSSFPPKDSDARRLHFHAGQFYAWDRTWRAVAPEEMRALVVKDLQANSDDYGITTHLVHDVLLNLQGMCLVERADEPLPFYIQEYGPPFQFRRRQLLALQNGMIDLEEVFKREIPKLQRFDSRWFGTTLLPYAYDPKAQCPKFKQFLCKVLELDTANFRARHEGDQRHLVLQEWFGYTLLCDGRLQKFLLMVGEGNNGKGVIQNLWVKMLGNANVSHVSLDQLSGRFALQPLLGKLANICGDLNEIDSVAEGILKRLTGQDNVTVDRKNLPLITMAPAVKLVFATNSLPRFKDKSRGIWRRLMVMPFRVSIPEGQENETLTEELESELPGILNWALRGLCHLLKEGHFIRCAFCAAARSEHQFDCDPVLQFLDELYSFPVPDAKVVRRIDADELYAQYDRWCKSANRKPLSSNEFSRRITKLPGVAKHRESRPDRMGKRRYYWVGLGEEVPEVSADDLDDSSSQCIQEREDGASG